MAEPTTHSDILIVGSGSAGSVLAERLSAAGDATVTVLEAGVGLTEPALSARAIDGLRLPIGAVNPLVRRYRTELTGRPTRSTTIVRGATVGGSGAVNGGYFCRALPGDFDGPGVPGWAWRDVVGHFRAIESDLDFHGPAHGDDGPIPVRRTAEMSDSTELFVAAAQRSGYGWIADLNDVAAPAAGVGAVPLNVVDGVRVGPGVGYLMPALCRPNLALLTGTRAHRLVIAGGRAVGIEAVGPAGPLALTADRTIVCAGAIGSAQLLMLSGVGDETMLKSAGIEVAAALPVGAQFIDHPEWVLPVGWAGAAGRPVLEAVLHTGDGLEIRPYTTDFVSMVYGAEGPAGRLHVGVALMQPRSRGRLTLLSTDPDVPLRIEHRYDSQPDDLAALRRGVELVREMLSAATEVGEPQWSTSQHLCASAPMGGEGDEGAVLDERCRVRGIEGLWVVDGSVLPGSISRGPHATIVMVGHRAAEFFRT